MYYINLIQLMIYVSVIENGSWTPKEVIWGNRDIDEEF